MRNILARQAWKAALDVPDVEPGRSAFSQGEEDDALWLDARQILNECSETELEIRLTRPVIRAEKAGVMADPRVSYPRRSSDWMRITIGGDADFPFVRHVIELAAAAHRPAEGAVTRRPPTGEAMARRRRFH